MKERRETTDARRSESRGEREWSLADLTHGLNQQTKDMLYCTGSTVQ